jgi:hypothetical protein
MMKCSVLFDVQTEFLNIFRGASAKLPKNMSCFKKKGELILNVFPDLQFL